MSDPEDVQRLIRLKRFETPGEGYTETFLENFKDRQRSEMLRASSRDLLFERVAMWWSESGAPRYVPVGAFAACALGAGIYWISAGKEDAAALPSANVAAVTEMPPASTDDPGKVEEVIRLKLPQTAAKAPALNPRSTPDNLMTVGAKGRYREL